MSAISLAWAAWIFPAAVRAALFVTALLLLDPLLRRCLWPQVRGALWLLVLPLLLAPPLPPTAVALFPVTNAPPAPDALFAFWAAGTLFFGAVAVGRYLRLRARLEACPPAPPSTLQAVFVAARRMGIRRAPRVVIDQNAATPAVLGPLRPILVLPAADFPHRDEALLHEMAHLRRRDLTVQMIWLLASVLYWFHPWVHLARRRGEETREIGCDLDVAARLGSEAPRYRAALLACGERLLGGGSPFFASLLHGPCLLAQRLRALRGSGALRRGLARLSALLLATALLPPMISCRAPLRPADARADAEAAFRAAVETGGCLPLRLAVLRLTSLQTQEGSRSPEPQPR